MKNRGFTLVELLAVIVILAVLALIATPVVLSIIDDAKESAMLRSAEMYLSGVENAVMRENMNSGGNFRPNECTISNGNMTCGSTSVEVEVDGEVPSTGSIVFENGKITEVTLNYESGTIIKDSSGSLVYEGSETSKTLDVICTYDSTNGIAAKTAGAKYSCEVKEGTSYNFYVLTTPKEGDTSINLIMDRNINSDGKPAESFDASDHSDWTNKEDYGSPLYPYDEYFCWDESGCPINNKGPITAMTYLYNATKDWINIEPVNYTYNDRQVQGISTDGIGYTSFVSTNGVAVITPLSGDAITIGTNDKPLRARMPIYSSDSTITEIASKTDANVYLYANLYGCDYAAYPYGYWTMSSDADSSMSAWSVQCSSLYDDIYRFDLMDVFNPLGVRPVITLKF